MARKDRRRFLTGVMAAGAATAITPLRAAEEEALAQAGSPVTPKAPSALPPTAQVAAAETQVPSELPPNRIGGVPGSDFMVDVLKTLNIKYCPANCASSCPTTSWRNGYARGRRPLRVTRTACSRSTTSR